MKTYKVTENNAVVLKAGTVFRADPEDVAGALRVGAVVEVEEGRDREESEKHPKRRAEKK